MAGVISGMSHVRLRAPDLGRMQAFLEDFGMVPVHRDPTRLFMRGIGPTPFLHVTELGEPGVASFGYDLQDAESLAALAALPGASGIESPDQPGGGRRVRVPDPNGLTIEFLVREPVEPLPPRPLLRGPDGASRSMGPARVRRLSHIAYQTPDVRAVIDWYRRTLGLLPTDELYVETEDNVLGQFLRVDAGETPVDHHVAFIMRGAKAGMHHASFEVETVDDVFFGGDYMRHKAHDHVRGIGRHALGSQIFHYWMSPFDLMHEHWSSSEKMNARSGFNKVRIGPGMAHDSGEKPPERFVKQASPIRAWMG